MRKGQKKNARINLEIFCPNAHSRGYTCLVELEHEKALVCAGHVSKNNNFATYLGVFCQVDIGMDNKDLTRSA